MYSYIISLVAVILVLGTLSIPFVLYEVYSDWQRAKRFNECRRLLEVDASFFINPDIAAYQRCIEYGIEQMRKDPSNARIAEYWNEQRLIRRRRILFTDEQLQIAFAEMNRRRAAGEPVLASIFY